MSADDTQQNGLRSFYDSYFVNINFTGVLLFMTEIWNKFKKDKPRAKNVTICRFRVPTVARVTQ
jgi:hypothetical protein